MTDQHKYDGRVRCRVLILGGGFGGLYTALGLERLLRPEDRTEVTLVNPDNFSLFTPMLCEVAGSWHDTRQAITPIRRMLRRPLFVEIAGEINELVRQAARA